LLFVVPERPRTHSGRLAQLSDSHLCPLST
jgi:hypothetical protein